MKMLALVSAGWFAATVFLSALILDWTGSLFVAVPAAVCVTTGAVLLLAGSVRR